MGRDGRQRRRSLRGGLLIGGIVSCAVLIFFLDDLVSVFDRTYAIVAFVPDAPGLAPGSPVWLGGKEVGAVTTVGFLPAGTDTLDRVWVTLELPRRLQPQVRKDSRVRITAAALISERVVDILPGTAAAPMLEPGDTLRRRPQLTAEQVTRRATIVRAQFDTLLAALDQIAPTARVRVEDARRAMTAMDRVNVEARRLRSDLRANEGLAMLADPTFAASVQRTRGHAAELPAALARLRERTAGSGDVADALLRLEAGADTLRAQLDAAAAVLDRTDGFIGRFRQDSALIRAVHAARASLDSLMTEVRQNPLRFIF